MKKIVLLISVIVVCGCTYPAKPLPMKPDMILNFHSDSIIKIVNSQKTEVVKIENAKDLGYSANLRETTEETINLLSVELLKNGVTISEESEKILYISLDNIKALRYFGALGCVPTITINTSSGLNKTFQATNVSASLWSACDFAITKAVANIVNDDEMRNFIDDRLNQAVELNSH
jgi:uncharacterized lipoprotein YajG